MASCTVSKQKYLECHLLYRWALGFLSFPHQCHYFCTISLLPIVLAYYRNMAKNLVFTLCYTNEKSCSVQTDITHWKTEHLSSGNLADFDVVKVTSDESQTAFFGLSPISKKSQQSNIISLNGLYATKIGLKNNSKVSAELLKNVSVCVKAFIEPVTVDDWEIIELHAQEIEGSLLDQIRVLWRGQVFPLWVSGSVCIFLRTVAIEPNTQCGILMPLTELAIEPKFNHTPPKVEDTHEKTSGYHNKKITDQEQKRPSTSEEYSSSQAISDEVKVDIDSPEESRRNILQRLMQLSAIRRLVQIISYICHILWHRILPTILGPFSLFQVAPKAIVAGSESSKLSENALASIQDFPHKFNLVLRVEPMHSFRSTSGLVSQMERYNEAGFAMLNTAKRACQCSWQHSGRVCVCNENDMDFRLFLVGLKKLPAKKSEENAPEPISSLEVEDTVIRLYVQSMSKFEMFFRDEDENTYDVSQEMIQSLKLSEVLRLQLEIGISSRVCIKKLRKIPKCAHGNVKKIVFQVLGDLSQNVSQEDLKISFERWLKEVADGSNPVPLISGCIFNLPVRKFLSSNGMEEEESGIMNTLVSAEKVLNNEDHVTSECFLLSSCDLSSMEVEFILKPPVGRKSINDIDPKIPHESIEGLIPAQKILILSCIKHAEAVFRTKPIASSLSGKNGHSGFVLLTGPSGTGRTHLSRVLLRKLATSNDNQAYVRLISCSNLKGKKPETIKRLLKNTVNELLWRQPSALLLDDIDHLVPSNNSVDGESSPSAVYALELAVIFKDILSKLCWTGNMSRKVSKVFVISTALYEQAIHPVLLPAQGCYLFSKILSMQLPENEERKQLLRAIVFRNIPLEKCLTKVDFGTVSNVTEGFSAKDFVQVTKKAIILGKNRISNKSSFSVRTIDFTNAVSGYTPISLQDANLHKPKKLSWSDVGGLKNIRKQLMEKLVWPMKYSHLYQSAGMQLRSGILLYGPPGCGKTLLAGVVANECNLNFISVKGPELLSKYIGASEAAVRELFNRASAASPCILFFDEFDSIGQKRGHDSTGVTDRVVNQILTHLDGVEPLSGVYVLAATSRPDLIDPAILRPGRLDTHLCCNIPDFDERCDILACLLEKLSLADQVNVRAIAARCEYFTGADLHALVYDAQLNALHSAVGFKAQLSENDGSILTQSSRSVTPTSIGMELDDGYDSNGMKSVVKDLKEEPIDQPESGSQLSVNDFTKTAAKLAESILQHNENEKIHSEDYKLCFGVSPPEPSVSPPCGFAIEGCKKSSGIIYFPSLYSKTTSDALLPESVQQVVNCMSNPTNHELQNWEPSAKSQFDAIKVSNYHFESVLSTASPSVSPAERTRYLEICRNFSGKDKIDDSSVLELRMQQRATLA